MNTRLPIATQLKRIRERSKVSMREMARRLGKSSSSYAHYENPERFKDKYLPYELAQQVARNLDAPFSHEVLALSGFETTENTAFRVIDLDYGNELTSDELLVPVFDISAAAGSGIVIDDYEAVASQLAFPTNYIKHITHTHPGQLAIISVIGKSMSPTLAHDDLVMVDMTKDNVVFDGIFVVRHEDVLKVKRLRWGDGKRTIDLISDNKEYEVETLPADEVSVVGKVVWTGRKEF